MTLRLAPAAVLLAVSGCQQPADPAHEHSARQNDTTLTQPAGRFQMMPNPGGEGLILLDTRLGLLRHCGVAPPQIACGPVANIPR